MNTSTAFRLGALAAILGVQASAGDTRQITAVAQSIWPGGQTVGIICNYGHSKDQIQDLLGSLPAGTQVRVADLRRPENLAGACNAIRAAGPHYLLLLPRDLFVRDGSFHASMVIRAMNKSSIPTLATSPAAIAQGAWAAAGPRTGNRLLVNPELKGYVDAWGEPMDPTVSSYWPAHPKGGATMTLIGTF